MDEAESLIRQMLACLWHPDPHPENYKRMDIAAGKSREFRQVAFAMEQYIEKVEAQKDGTQ